MSSNIFSCDSWLDFIERVFMGKNNLAQVSLHNLFKRDQMCDHYDISNIWQF